MKSKKRFFALGKLKHDYLENLINKFVFDIQDKRVVVGSKIGEDAAVIDMGDKYLVSKTDPITFTTNEIGYYAVNVNVNDVVCTGATPKWFQSVILLPEKKTTEDLVENIFKSIHDTCQQMGISVVGGHTEITTGLERPIVIGSLLGEVAKEKVVLTSGAEPGDALILTKGIFIEGTSIIGREKADFLKNKGYDLKFIEKCKNYLYDPGISVFKEALLANQQFKIKAMHDPTEGGVACAIKEMTIASNTGALIEEDKVIVLPEPLELSKIFNLNPMGTISSGSLLIAIEDKFSAELISLLNKNNIFAEKIGMFTPKEKSLMIREKSGKIRSLKYSETDEITRIF